jgi:hypothetical protein
MPEAAGNLERDEHKIIVLPSCGFASRSVPDGVHVSAESCRCTRLAGRHKWPLHVPSQRIVRVQVKSRQLMLPSPRAVPLDSRENQGGGVLAFARRFPGLGAHQ